MSKALRPGFWKPYLTGSLSGIAASLPALASGNIPGAISSGIAGGKIGYNAHEAIRQKYNIPWLGKRGKGRRVVMVKSYKRKKPVHKCGKKARKTKKRK